MKATFAPTSEPAALPISVIIITLNEAHNIVECLASVRFASQVIVLDSGSTDGTVELARQAGAQVYQTSEWPGFGPQKNRALDYAEQPWVLSLDADERIPPVLAAEIAAHVLGNRQAAAEMPRRTQFCGQWINHCGWSPDHVTRLWPRGTARFSESLVHERLVTQNLPVVRFKHKLEHYSYPTPAHYWDKLAKYSQAWAMERYTKGQNTTMARAAGSGFVAFVRSYFLRLGFLDGALGFAVCVMQAQSAFGKYFTLYGLNRQTKRSDRQ
jgi:glycosyltransferase involved in cell wall biosynthesis